MLMSCFDAYISMYGVFVLVTMTTRSITSPLAYVHRVMNHLYGGSLCKKYNIMMKDYAHGIHINYANRTPFMSATQPSVHMYEIIISIMWTFMLSYHDNY